MWFQSGHMKSPGKLGADWPLQPKPEHEELSARIARARARIGNAKNGCNKIQPAYMGAVNDAIE